MFGSPVHVIKIKRKNKIQPIRKEISSPFDEDNDSAVNNTDMDILNQLISMSSNNKEKPKKKAKKEKDSGKKAKKNKSKNKNNDKNMFDIFGEDEDIDNITERSKKDREDVDFYEDRFKGSLLLLKGLMQEVNATTIDSKDHIQTLKKSPSARGSAMAIANQSGTVSTLLNTKLSIIKEITAVNKSISDLELKSLEKKMKNKASEDKGKDSSAYLDDMFERIMNSDIPIPDADDYQVSAKKSSLNKDGLDARLDNLMESGELEFTDSEDAFKYEASGGVEIAIIYETGTKNKKWEFVALDSEGEELHDYPLPSKKSCGRMEFDIENDVAKDKLCNIYRLIYVNGEYDSYDND